MKHGLTDKQIRFCKEYLIDFNGTEAAKRAGYSKKTAYSIANENLKKPEIQNYIKELSKNTEKKLECSRERVLYEIMRLAFFDPGKLFDENGFLKDIHDIDEDTRRSIASVTISTIKYKNEKEYETKNIKFTDKSKNLKMLGRYFTLFTDKTEHDIKFKKSKDDLQERLKAEKNIK